jgi:peptide/nickel transport system permease protein
MSLNLKVIKNKFLSKLKSNIFNIKTKFSHNLFTVKFILDPLFNSLITVFFVTFLVFIAIRLVPGDPVTLMLGESSSYEQIEHIREQLGLNKSIKQQTTEYYKNLLNFSLGESLVRKTKIGRLIKERFVYTFYLALVTSIISGIIGLSLGLISAYAKFKKQKSTILKITNFYIALNLAIPNFWIGPILIFLFSLHWPWLPFTGFENFLSLILPSLTLSLGMSASLAKTAQTAIYENLNADYLNTARAKGNPEWRTLIVHALPNALIPIIMVFSLQLGNLLTGTVITEMIFNWPGLGTLTYEAILSRDYPLVQACVLIISLIYILINFLTKLFRLKFSPKEFLN